MKQLNCAHCGNPFWKLPGSESVYCSKEHSREAKSLKLSAIGTRFNTAHARAHRTQETFDKQQSTMLRKVGVNRPGPDKAWFEQCEPSMKEKLREMMGSQQFRDHIANKRGRISKYGLRFDAEVEVFFYEDMMRRNIFTERSVPFNGWTVDFNIPAKPIMVETKSWWTVMEYQGISDVVSKIDPKILLVEEQDIYNLKNVGDDPFGYLEERSSRFISQLLEVEANAKS